MRLKKKKPLRALLWWACWSVCLSGGALVYGGQYEEALQALSDGIPQVAAYKLEACLKKATTASERMQYATALARALLESNRPERAVEVLKPFEKNEKDETRFWFARALLASGKVDEAKDQFHRIVENQDSAWDGPARIGEAACLRILDQSREALAVLHPLPVDKASRNPASLLAAEIHLNHRDPEAAKKILEEVSDLSDAQKNLRDFLLARCDFESGNLSQAVAGFGRLAHQKGNINPLLTAASAQLGAAALQKTGDASGAEKLLENFIQENASSPKLADIFETLDSVYAREDEPTITEVKKWAGEQVGERAILAAFYRARLEARIGTLERAMEFYRAFLANHPDHMLTWKARLELALIYLAQDQPGEAQKVLESPSPHAPTPSPSLAARLAFADGEASAALNQFSHAAEQFQKAGSDPKLAEIARENMSRAALRSGDQEKYAVPPEGTGSLETALELARLRSPFAEEALQRITSSGREPEASRARLALAERAWERNDRTSARAGILRISNVSEDPEVQERADFLALMLADDESPGSDERVVARVQEYLSRHPDAPHEGEVRFKLGEVLFRKGDYRASRLQFVEAARLTKSAELREQALFFAGVSAARGVSPGSLTQAIEHFEAVAALNGSLAAEARLEEATVKNALGESADALVIIDRAMETDKGGSLHWRGVSEKGDTLLQMAKEDPSRMKQAVEVYRSLAQDAHAPLRWRNEGFYKLGIVLSKMGDRDGALAAYYNVLNAPQTETPEFFWYYKAGFEAGQMLEEQSLWKEAIAVYDKMAHRQGPRSEEARARMDRLRLENFLWIE